MKFWNILLVLFICKFTSTAQDSLYQQSLLYSKEEKFEDAIILLDTLIAQNDNQAQYFKDKANYQLALGKVEDAINTLTKGLKTMPDSLSFYDMRGLIFEAYRLYDKAILDYSIAIDKTNNPKFKSHLLSNRGGTKGKIMDYEGAYQDLIEAIEVDSTNLDALNNLAVVCDEVNRPDETIIYLERIIQIDSTYVPAYVNLGFKQQLLKNHKEAIQYFDQAIVLMPNAALAYSNRSFSKLKLKDLSGAMKDIDYSLELMPSNSYAYKIKALIFIEERKYKEACVELEIAQNLGYKKNYGEEVAELKEKYCNKSISN